MVISKSKSSNWRVTVGIVACCDGELSKSVESSSVLQCVIFVSSCYRQDSAVPMCIFIQDVSTLMRMFITLNKPLSKETSMYTEFY